MSNSLNYDFLSYIKEEYEVVECLKEDDKKYLYKVKNQIKPANEILKVIDVKSCDKKNIEKYLKAVRKLNEMSCGYLMKYSIIEENNGYIYLIMPEYYGSLKDYHLDYFNCGYAFRGIVIDDDDDIKDDSNDESDNSEIEYDSDDKRFKCKYQYQTSGYFTIYQFFRDIIYGLEEIHKNGYYHGKIKKSNIFANRSSFILSDYCLYLLEEDKDEYDEYDEYDEDDDGKTNDIKKVIKIIDNVLSEYYEDKDEYRKIVGEDEDKLSKKDDFKTLLNKISKMEEIADMYIWEHKYRDWSPGSYTDVIERYAKDEKFLKNDVCKDQCKKMLYRKKIKKLKEEIKSLKEENEIFKRKCGEETNTNGGIKRKKLL